MQLTCRSAALVVVIWSLVVASARADDAPFESEIRAFEAADRQSPPPSGVIVFVGSSSIRKWTSLSADFPGHTVLNRGFGGSQVADSVAYADRIVTPYAPPLVVMYAGSNDLHAGK